jgi:hypothetical protein
MDIKRIETKEGQLKKTKKRNLIIGIILVLIMVFGTAGYAVDVALSNKSSNNNADQIKYKGIDFIKDNNGYWEFSYNSMTFATQYNPLELNDTKVSPLGLSLANYKGQVLSFSWNESQESVLELDRNFEGNKIPLRVVPQACISENCSGNYPIKNCSVDNVIVFQIPMKNEKEMVYSDENCVFIIANETNQVKYSDAFLYKLLGI